MLIQRLSRKTGLKALVQHPISLRQNYLSLHLPPIVFRLNMAQLNATTRFGMKYKITRHLNFVDWKRLTFSTGAQSSSNQGKTLTKATPISPAHQKQVEKVYPMSSQLANPAKTERSLAKLVDHKIDLSSKKMGWLVSGTIIGLMSVIFGKLYMLFGAVPLFLYHSKDMDVLSKTFNRDSKFLWRYTKCWLLAKRIKNQNLTLPKIFQQTEKKYPDKIMLQMHDQHWKYKDVASYANRTSRLMQKYGFHKGDVIAMFALNSPELVATVLGMSNIGVITTLISTELRNKGLTQAIKNSGCKGIIFDDELMHAFDDVYKSLNGVKIFQMRHKAKQPEFHVLEEELLKECNDLPEVFVNVHHDDPLLYMYASDDTVFTEPIVISHEKFLFDSTATAMMLDLNSSEKIYNPTPLHEPAGMLLGIGPSITNGVTTVLKSKFSAEDYFRECYVYNCTVGQYAGNMCKHLLLSPVSPIETFHPVRAMYGCGLESDYWQEFVNRFGTKMYEVHDASRENINLINLEGKIGVIGFRPKIAPSFMFPHFVIKVFGKDNIPVRSEDGLCQLCDCGEPGMLIKLWTGSANLPSKVKTIKNIFKNGDMAITTGEILTMDEYLYLRPLNKHVDKSWMNKLVTSEEVEFIASKLTSKRCAAYSLPFQLGYKQDIEILAIEDPSKTLNMKKFTDDLVDHLPRNWVPHYVRIVSKFELSPSNTVNKKLLIEQGLNMERDLVHYFDKGLMCYKPLTWAKVSRPQMIVNEAKVQPLINTGVRSQKTSISDTSSKVHIIPNSEKKSSTTIEFFAKTVPQVDPKPLSVMVEIKPVPANQEEIKKETKPTHQTAPLVTEKTPHDCIKPEVVTNILKDLEAVAAKEEKQATLAAKLVKLPKKVTNPASTATKIPKKVRSKNKTVVPSKTANTVILQSSIVTPPKATSDASIKPTSVTPANAKKENLAGPLKHSDFTDIISTKMKNAADPIMTKVMKKRLAENEQITKPHAIPSSKAGATQSNLQANQNPVQQQQSPILIKNILKMRNEATAPTTNESTATNIKPISTAEKTPAMSAHKNEIPNNTNLRFGANLPQENIKPGPNTAQGGPTKKRDTDEKP